jgi:hypothetical protein
MVRGDGKVGGTKAITSYLFLLESQDVGLGL